MHTMMTLECLSGVSWIQPLAQHEFVGVCGMLL